MTCKTPESEIARLKALLLEGKSYVDAAKVLEWPLYRVRNLVKRTGVYRKAHDKKGAIRNQVRRMVIAGLTDREIGEKLGRNRTTIKNSRQGLGLPCNREKAGRNLAIFASVRGCSIHEFGLMKRMKERHINGWPMNVSDAEWRLMSCLEKHGALSVREMQGLLNRSRGTLHYALAKCIAFGWVLRIGREYDLARDVRERRAKSLRAIA